MLNQILYKEDMEENCTCITVFKVLLLQNTSCCYFKFQSQVLLYSMEIIYLDLQLTPVVIFRCFCQGCIENCFSSKIDLPMHTLFYKNFLSRVISEGFLKTYTIFSVFWFLIVYFTKLYSPLTFSRHSSYKIYIKDE